MRFIILMTSIMLATMTAGFILKTSNPSLYLRIVLNFDFVNIVPDGKAEKLRLEQIDLLPISDEKKDILINRTIFLGATPAMVRLAIGEPRNVITPTPKEQSTTGQSWIYHFQEDMTPTALIFNEGRLSSARTLSQNTLTTRRAP